MGQARASIDVSTCDQGSAAPIILGDRKRKTRLIACFVCASVAVEALRHVPAIIAATIDQINLLEAILPYVSNPQVYS